MTDWWYVITTLAAYDGKLHASEYNEFVGGSDPVDRIKRYRRQFERDMAKLYPNSCWKHGRAGQVYAVWRLPRRIPQSQLVQTVKSKPVWRVYVMTHFKDWGGLIEMTLPPGAELFRALPPGVVLNEED